MKVTTRGQVTIPVEIREQLGIQPGDEVEFIVEGNVVKMIPTRTAARHELRIMESLRGRATVKMTTDEILALTRGEV